MLLLKKILISIVLIVILTLSFSFRKTQEGLSDIPDIGNLIKTGFNDAFKPIQDFFKKTFEEPIHEIITVIKEAEKFFESIPSRLDDIKNGMDGIGEGIKMEFDNLGVALKTGFGDIFTFVGLFKYMFSYVNEFFNTYIGSRINCGIEKISKFRDCFMYYFFDLIGYTLYYVFIELPIWVIKLITGQDLQPGVDMVQRTILCMDEFIYGMVGFHITKYSKSVFDECYICHNLKDMPEFPVKPFKEQIHKINVDWNKAIPEYLNQPKSVFEDSGNQFKAAFSDNPRYNKKTPSSFPSIQEIERKYGLDV
jgi:hypothetical protein